MVVPHIVRSQSINQGNLRSIDTGVGNTSIDLRHVSTDGPVGNPSAAPPANAPPEATPPHHSSAVEHPNVGVVPGQSAMAAAPALMAQMHASADVNGETASSAAAGHAPPSPSAVVPVSPTAVSPTAPVRTPRPVLPATAGPALVAPPMAAPTAVAPNSVTSTQAATIAGAPGRTLPATAGPVPVAPTLVVPTSAASVPGPRKA